MLNFFFFIYWIITIEIVNNIIVKLSAINEIIFPNTLFVQSKDIAYSKNLDIKDKNINNKIEKVPIINSLESFLNNKILKNVIIDVIIISKCAFI